MSTTPKIRLTRRGVFQNGKIVAPAIRLFARGKRLTDDSHVAQFRFRDMSGADKSIYLEWEFTIPEKKRELKSKLATAGYRWPRDKNLADAIWAALVDTNPKRRFVFASAPGWYKGGFALPGK